MVERREEERGREGGKKRGKEGGPREDGGREGGRKTGAPHQEKAAHHAQDGGRLPQEQPPVRDISAQEARLQQICKAASMWRSMCRLPSSPCFLLPAYVHPPDNLLQNTYVMMCVHTYVHKLNYVNYFVNYSLQCSVQSCILHCKL